MKFKTGLIYFLSCIWIVTVHSTLAAQSNSAAIYKDIQKFGVLANVLYVAAHPDDENTRLISYLSNHLSTHTTYLSLTRGDGGQNLIGSEIREMLGIIRTHELLEARKIDGGHQMFTRANDFGYSKSATETFNIWGKQEILSDVVWAIRQIKPDIIINRFNTDTSRPNHGHHTASAILSVEAFDLAADKNAFPEQLQYVDVWQPQRMFFNTSYFFYGSRENFEKVDKSKMVIVDIGSYDEVTGESNSEIAARSRSMHKSQGFGSAETRGESLEYLDLIKDADGYIPKKLFEGIDITWNRVEGGANLALKSKELEETFDFRSPSKSIPVLLEIYQSLQLLPESYWKKIKTAECEKLIRNCLGLFVELRTSQFTTSPELNLPVTLEVINRSNVHVVLQSVQFGKDNPIVIDSTLIYNQGMMKELIVRVPDRLSIPYWLTQEPGEGLYSVSDQEKRGLPADPPAIISYVKFIVAGQDFTFEVPVIYRTIDPAVGEVYRPVGITPPVTVNMESDVLVFSAGTERIINMTLTAIKDSIAGVLELKIPEKGWTVSPAQIPWSLARAGESIALACTITPPLTASSATIRPELIIRDNAYHHSVATIDYDHLPYMSVVKDATAKLKSLDIKITRRPIAYIEGAGDDVDEALEQLGYDVDVLSPAGISAAMLNKYQVVILGVRAFNTIEELTYKNKLLFDWVKSGGTAIVQYNTNRGLVTEDIAPYSLTLSRDRTTEESSPVTLLAPDHPALNYPNKIQATDFDGWVQERGLYFPNQWAEQFTPLLQMNDTGENPSKGSLLVAQYGEGYYVYTGLSFFRHLPAGVSGSYRLMSNLISLGFKSSKS